MIESSSIRRSITTIGTAIVCLCSLLCGTSAKAQETKIWEFSPYVVKLWFNFDASVPVSDRSKSKLMSDITADLERTFKATWQIQSMELPQQLSRDVSRKLQDLSIADISRNEFVLIISTTQTETKTTRTYEAAGDAVSQVYVSPSTFAAITSTAVGLNLPSDSATAKLLAKLKVDDQGDQSIIDSIKGEKITAAFIPRWRSEGIGKTRVLHTMLPWQSESYLNEHDKIYFINVTMEGDEFRLAVRELDCPVVHLGPMFVAGSSNWASLPHLGSHLLQHAFAPVARVDNAGTSWAELRHKAGGLIVDENEEGEVNPARIRVGDVLHPFVRRDDRNGVPLLLQALTFTYCAVTESDGVKMRANIYTYSGGPGLQGKQNRRTSRLLLRVRPAVEESDVKVVVRGNTKKAQPGCFLYTKDFLTEEFKFIGRTDWRGRVHVPMPEESVRVLPDTIRSQRFDALIQAKRDAIAQAQKEYEALVKKAEDEGLPVPKPPDAPPVVVQAPIDPATTIKLNNPLMLLYIKSGDTVLAKLPYVPGLQEIDTAELLDDTLRLQSEAIVRGYQSEILDLIGKRNLYAARAKLLLKNGKLEEATKFVDKLRELPDFNNMNDELGSLERKILDQAAANPPPRAGQIQIDRMFKSTREMLQKYLQEDVASTMSDQLRKANAGELPSGT